MENTTKVKVTNRYTGSLGYTLPEMHVARHFEPRETKEIEFEELKALYNAPGGRRMVEEKLAIKDEEAIAELAFSVEPEYFYTETDVKNIMVNGSLDAFLDMLDFAPDSILGIVKALAVSLPLNDVKKRDAILDKLQFNVTRAIEIENTKFDGGDDAESTTTDAPKRRVNAASAKNNTGLPIRRVTE